MTMKSWLINITVWFSQTINVWLLAGHPDQTVSARAYVHRRDRVWRSVYRAINWLVFWQEDHCYTSHMEDVERAAYIQRLTP